MALTPETLAAALLSDEDLKFHNSFGEEVSPESMAEVCRVALDKVQERPDDMIPAELREVAAILLLPVTPAPMEAFGSQMMEAAFVAKPGMKISGAVMNMTLTARVLHVRDLLYQHLERNKPGA